MERESQSEDTNEAKNTPLSGTVQVINYIAVIIGLFSLCIFILCLYLVPIFQFHVGIVNEAMVFTFVGWISFAIFVFSISVIVFTMLVLFLTPKLSEYQNSLKIFCKVLSFFLFIIPNVLCIICLFLGILNIFFPIIWFSGFGQGIIKHENVMGIVMGTFCGCTCLLFFIIYTFSTYISCGKQEKQFHSNNKFGFFIRFKTYKITRVLYILTNIISLFICITIIYYIIIINTSPLILYPYVSSWLSFTPICVLIIVVICIMIGCTILTFTKFIYIPNICSSIFAFGCCIVTCVLSFPILGFIGYVVISGYYLVDNKPCFSYSGSCTQRGTEYYDPNGYSIVIDSYVSYGSLIFFLLLASSCWCMLLSLCGWSKKYFEAIEKKQHENVISEEVIIEKKNFNNLNSNEIPLKKSNVFINEGIEIHKDNYNENANAPSLNAMDVTGIKEQQLQLQLQLQQQQHQRIESDDVKLIRDIDDTSPHVY